MFDQPSMEGSAKSSKTKHNQFKVWKKISYYVNNKRGY